MSSGLDTHYWNETAHAECLRDALLALVDDYSKQGKERRALLAAELAAFEAHMQRELSEAAFLGVGHRHDMPPCE
jgi:hypothetical protein